MDILEISLSVLFIVNILLAILLIFIERKNPTSTWAWLMVLIIIPGIGFMLYLFLGQNLSRKKIFDVKLEEDFLHKKLMTEQKLLKKHKFIFKDMYAHKYSDMIYMNYINSQSLFTQNNNVKIYTNGQDKFQDLIYSIKNAKEHIHLVYYIINPDKLGTKIVSILTEKAKEGVEVRLLYDAMGGRKLPKKFFQLLIEAGGKVGCFFPATIPHINIRMNYRNHRKIAVIDGQIGFIGGINIGDEYLGESDIFGYWRDTHIKIEGDAVDDLQRRFLLDWRYASKEKISLENKYFPKKINTGEIGIQIISSGPDSIEEQIRNCYLKMITSAKKYIYIQSPYFVPDESIFEALRVAALSGVDVRLMIPNKPDHPFVYWASLWHAGDLMYSGVKTYTYEKGFIHSKTIVVDDMISTVGTANIDIRSFKLNFEINAFIYDENIAILSKNIFLEDIKDCKLITKEQYENRSRTIKFKESVSRLLSPIL